jgi:hypothetical protein
MGVLVVKQNSPGQQSKAVQAAPAGLQVGVGGSGWDWACAAVGAVIESTRGMAAAVPILART